MPRLSPPPELPVNSTDNAMSGSKSIAIVGHEQPVLAVLRARENEDPTIFQWNMGVSFLGAIAGGLTPERPPEHYRLRGKVLGKHLDLACFHPKPKEKEENKYKNIRTAASWPAKNTWTKIPGAKGDGYKRSQLVILHAASELGSDKDTDTRNSITNALKTLLSQPASLTASPKLSLIYINDSIAPQSDVWSGVTFEEKSKTVTANWARNVIIVASIHGLANWLRLRLSGTYEAMTVDLLNGLRSELAKEFPHNDKEHASCHLVVRLGNAAALLIWRDKAGADDGWKATLYYRKDRLLALEHPGLGEMQGYRSIVAVALAAAIGDEDGVDEKRLGDGIVRGLDYCRRFFEDGWPVAEKPDEDVKWHTAAEEVAKQIEKSARKWAEEWEEPETKRRLVLEYLDKLRSAATSVDDKNADSKKFEELQKAAKAAEAFEKSEKNGIGKLEANIPTLKISVARAIHPRKPWSILQQFVFECLEKPGASEAKNLSDKLREPFMLPQRDEHPAGGWDATYYAAWAWRMLCSHQHFDDLIKDIPIAKLGKFRLLDRDEMQDFLGLHRLLVQYAGNREDAKPLNFGVFGAPGAGKSFGVKQVIEDLADAKLDYEKEPIICNLSQLEDRQGLIEVLHRVRNAGLKGKIPVVFFDEFDTRLEGRPFGWLGHFLAPMQDGEFEANGKTYHLGRCACFFAGGVSRTFAEMAARQRDTEFCQAKGPDFISRLRASLNIRGINRPEDEADPGRYLIRRALTLRDILHRRREKELGERKRGVDPRLAWAFLRITGFKHGVRSLEAIINSCRFEPGKRLRASDLPPTEQLSIHVDAAEFLALLDDEPVQDDTFLTKGLIEWLEGSNKNKP